MNTVSHQFSEEFLKKEKELTLRQIAETEINLQNLQIYLAQLEEITANGGYSLTVTTPIT